jgi:Ca-activated chloride channel family protein
MRWLDPQALWLIVPLVFFTIVALVLARQAQVKFRAFASPEILAVLTRGVDPWRRKVRFALGVLAVFFAILALARPQMGSHEETLASEGLDLAVLIDVSNSMLVEDVVPSRLKKAKHLVKNFVDRLSGDRVGIVAFAGSAYPAVPLTTDYEFVKQSLDVIDEASIANQGSNLAKALEVGIDLLVRGGTTEDSDSSSTADAGDSSSRTLIVISDGEATEGEEAKLADRLKKLGIKVFTIAVGSTKGGPIPLRDQMGYLRGYKKDQSGAMILSKVETNNLEAIATKTSGKFYNASSNEGEVEEILNRLSSFERTSGEGRRVIVYDELFQYPLGLAVFFVLLMIGLNDTRKNLLNSSTVGRAEASAVLLLTLMGLTYLLIGQNVYAGTSISEYESTRKGIEAYEQKDFTAATQEFGKAQAANPESMIHRMNLGDALLMGGSPEGAISEFENVTKSKDANEAARGAYNLGKAYEAQNNLEKALQSYQQGLARLAENPDKADPEVELRIKRALEKTEQQKQSQKQQQNSGQGDSQNQQNQQKQQNDKTNDEKKDQKQAQIPKQKPKFKAEKLGDSDAKRILQQLQEQEKKSQQRVMRGKTAGKPDPNKNGKDW